MDAQVMDFPVGSGVESDVPETRAPEDEFRPKQTHITPPSPSGLMGRLRGAISSLRTKLILPYTVLSLVTAMVGIFVVTRLVTSSIRERFANQLLEASRVTGDGIVLKERVHLEHLRLMAFTQGVPDAVAAADKDSLEPLLYPLVLNGNVDFLTATDRNGKEIISLVKDPTSRTYSTSQGGDLSTLDLIAKPLKGVTDPLGDKFSGVVQTIYGPYLVTTAPVRIERTQGSETVGVLMIGTRLDAIISELKAQALGDVIILDSTGKVMATTLAEPEGGFQTLGLSPYQAAHLEPALTRDLTLSERAYQALYAPLVVRQATVGVLGVVLPSNFIVTTESTSRNTFSLIFTGGVLAIIVMGYLLSESISRPVLRLRDASLAVASGDLDQRTGMRRADEIGQLAAVFDLMTFRLRRRTAQAARLYAETVKRNKDLAEANTQLQVAQQQLVQSEKLAAVGQLTAGIVHDVKNPLGVIKGLAEEIQEDLGKESPIVSRLSVIRDNASRANNIVSDLLKFARQSDPEMRYQNLCETVKTALRLTDFLARKGGVKIGTEFQAPSIMTAYDAQQLEQVLINLIQNAIQAMPYGGSLWVRVTHTDEWVDVAVQDTGVGIPKENLKRIFDPFFTTKPKGEGTGLGLSVSYGIVAQHKGRIDVQSVVGQGTTFTVHLPRTRGPARDAA
jgi:signal transduction histidine kinase